jgi:hypothetical protein
MTLGPWLTLGLVLTPLALLAVALRRPRYVLAQPAYTRWLLRPWRLLTFLPALVGIVVIAPYTGDPYWDAVDASVMALATFTTAPWAVGSFWRWQTTRIDELAAALVQRIRSSSPYLVARIAHAGADRERARSVRPSRSSATATKDARTKAARCPAGATAAEGWGRTFEALYLGGVWEAAPKGERSKALEEQLKTIDQTLVMREMAKIRAAVDTLVAWIDEQP